MKHFAVAEDETKKKGEFRLRLNMDECNSRSNA